ncbi:phosphoenolpyruvate--protein phosphotransferase [Clostridium estertheticum]|uniref:phosphoenolpyruvate--protein phosphotransferase n=1 Tax=Clostridium estertheticum TaxID=238834 RepID=UPI001CF5EA9C|nr:phosphoenolpyruvate--protein phosphotransferase [Clostridium estertheticum]MCB2362487.1 phosphoenolpyruvate--protein phosphotransferase [Clostridium estertheticum]
MILGTGASPGIAMGKVLILQNEEFIIKDNIINDVEAEKFRFFKALEDSKNELLQIKDKALIEFGEEKAAIFEAHLMVLEDPELISSTVDKIEGEKFSADYCFKVVTTDFIELFEGMDNEYMRERVTDIRDVSQRVLGHMLGIKSVDLSILKESVLLVSNDLTPSETANMDKEKVLGFLTNIGGRTSHTAIMARSLEIPAVVGLGNITTVVKQGDYVIIDGDRGKVLINPDAENITFYNKLKEECEKTKHSLQSFKEKASVTSDGKKVELAGNIGTPGDITGLISNGAEGVGLFRTEFIYMNKDCLPTEEEQFDSYKTVLESLSPKPVVIRTLDAGGDKKLSYLNIDKEMNPFLGYRAIRICLKETDLFKTQLRALLRASVYGNLKIMFPMISSLEELLLAKNILNEVKAEMDTDKIAYDSKVEVGMMIEVPSAAIISDILAKHVDFLSIGTNDLIQYTCAVDRMNERIHHLYSPFNPAVLRLIKMVIDNGHKEGIWVGMCGEMAGDKKIIPILLGMGLDEFSMSPISILPARKLIHSLSYENMKKFTDVILKMTTSEDIERYIEKVF